MKSRIWLAAAAMSISSLALAQTGVTENTDPARIAAIEQHAQQLASGGPATPMMDGAMHKHGMGHHKHHKGTHKKAMKDKASDKPMADSKG